MAALTQNRSTLKLPPEGVLPDLSYVPVAAATKIWQGSLVCINAAGLAIPATAGLSGQVCIGRAENLADNSTGVASAISVTVRSGALKWNNSSAGDLIAQAHLGWDVYAADDQTVALTDGNGTRPKAGKVFQVDSDGIWVVSGFIETLTGTGNGAGAAAGSVISIPVTLASIAAGTIATFTPGFAGRVKSITYIPSAIATTAAKLATVQVQIAGVSTTGGALALTTAACGTLAVNVAGSPITALNTFTAAQAISLFASAVTAFVEGSGSVQIVLA